jgi:linoleoyl-CoA desaturase
MPKVTFDNRNNIFFQSLKESVDQYFQTNNIKKTGDWRLFLKTIILVSSAITIYCSLIFLQLSTLPAILLTLLFGFNLACIGFSVMHDANHGSYSTRQ